MMLFVMYTITVISLNWNVIYACLFTKPLRRSRPDIHGHASVTAMVVCVLLSNKRQSYTKYHVTQNSDYVIWISLMGSPTRWFLYFCPVRLLTAIKLCAINPTYMRPILGKCLVLSEARTSRFNCNRIAKITRNITPLYCMISLMPIIQSASMNFSIIGMALCWYWVGHLSEMKNLWTRIGVQKRSHWNTLTCVMSGMHIQIRLIWKMSVYIG